MLLAIDVGNTHSVFGVWDGSAWRAVWRRATEKTETADQIGAWLHLVASRAGLESEIKTAICASVVPGLDEALHAACESWFGLRLEFLRSGPQVGFEVQYTPADSLGADRLSNALAARAMGFGTTIVVDFGTATKFEVIRDGVYVGGAIMPGFRLSADALFGKAAKLPTIPLTPPTQALGHNTADALRSGIVLGYAEGVEGLLRRLQQEVGPAHVIASGGLGEPFVELCPSIQSYHATLTLDGLVIASGLLTSA